MNDLHQSLLAHNQAIDAYLQQDFSAEPAESAPEIEEQQLADMMKQRDQVLRQLHASPPWPEAQMQALWQEQLELNRRWQARATDLRDKAQQLLVGQRRNKQRTKAYQQ